MTGFELQPSDSESGTPLPRPILDISIRRKDKDLLSELHIDIGEQAKSFGASDLADLIAKLITALSNQVLPKLLDHLHIFEGVLNCAHTSITMVSDPSLRRVGSGGCMMTL